MSDFRQLSANVWASPQIDKTDIAEAVGLGIRLIINNRPDGEASDQTEGAAIAAATEAAGLRYLAIPVAPGGFTMEQVTAMAQALRDADSKVLAYCRSGTRSTLLWALARSSMGDSPQELVEAAQAAGYDLAPIAAAMASLAANPQT